MGKKKTRDFADLPDYDDEEASGQAAGPAVEAPGDAEAGEPAAGATKKAGGAKGKKKKDKKGAKGGFADSDEEESTQLGAPPADSDEEFSSKPKPGERAILR